MWGKCGGCVNTKKLTTGLVRIEKSWWQCGRGDENEVWWSLASHAPGILWTVWGNLSHWIKAGVLWLRDTCGQCRMCQECTCTNLCSYSTPNIFYILCSVSWLVETQVDELSRVRNMLCICSEDGVNHRICSVGGDPQGSCSPTP